MKTRPTNDYHRRKILRTLEKDYDNRKIAIAAVWWSVGRVKLGCVWRHAATAQVSASLRWRTVLAASAMPLPASDGVQQCG